MLSEVFFKLPHWIEQVVPFINLLFFIFFLAACIGLYGAKCWKKRAKALGQKLSCKICDDNLGDLADWTQLKLVMLRHHCNHVCRWSCVKPQSLFDNFSKQAHLQNVKGLNILTIKISKLKYWVFIIQTVAEVSSNFIPIFLTFGVGPLEMHLWCYLRTCLCHTSVKFHVSNTYRSWVMKVF